MTRTRRLTLLAALALCACLVAVGPASGATTVGQLFDPTDGCAPNSIYLQTGVASGTEYTIPTDGVVTSWSYQLDNAAISGLRLEIAGPGSAGSHTIIGRAAAATQTPGRVNSYAAQIPVKAGDVIGIYFGSGGNCLLGTGTGDTIDYHAGDLSPGASAMFAPLTGNRLPVQATVEPDADHDGAGDETQDQCPSSAATQGPCTSPPVVIPTDTKPPSLTIASVRRVKLSRRGSISFRIKSDEAASGTATGSISLPKSARVLRFKRTRFALTAGRLTKVTLKLSKRRAKAARAALAHHRLKAKVTLSVNDAAGNTSTKKLALKLRR